MQHRPLPPAGAGGLSGPLCAQPVTPADLDAAAMIRFFSLQYRVKIIKHLRRRKLRYCL